MVDSREQRMAVLFGFLVGTTGTETFEMLKRSTRMTIIEKPKCLSGFTDSKGEMSIDDQYRSGRPSTARIDENVTEIREIVLENRRRAIEDVSDVYL